MLAVLVTLSRERHRVSTSGGQVRPRRAGRQRRDAAVSPAAVPPAAVSPAAAPASAPARAGPDAPARAARSRGRRVARGPGPVVAVTGAAQGLGHALTARLAQSRRVKKVVAIDDHRGEATGVVWRVVDVRDPVLAGRLAGGDVVVHTDVDLAPDSADRERRAFNVRGAQTVLTAAAAEGVGRVVLVTSAMVYGARPDNPVPLAETAPLRADQDTSIAGDLIEIEHLAGRAPRAYPGIQGTGVRPAALVGDAVVTLIPKHFS